MDNLKARKDEIKKAYDSLGPTVKKLIELQASRVGEMSELNKQIADSEVTYSIGDRFKTNYEKIILTQVWTGEANLYKYALVRLRSGQCWNGYFSVYNPIRITVKEISDKLGCLTRYWDARKQCKC